MTRLESLKSIGVNVAMMIRFASYADARQFSLECDMPRAIIQGDDNRFWVVSPKCAKALIRHGFERAE